MRIIISFEKSTNRVKSLSFHPTRPWILTSHHNGYIVLYDYKMKTKLDEWKEHEGAVRGVQFHDEEPYFVSGGDDYKVKVWDYNLRKCLYTLEGHKDYLRTVDFHKRYDWIASASDDQTIRIWNWKTRQCLSTVSGHTHYVMCARFHPTKDLMVSCSLDQDIRVWDLSKLASAPPPPEDFLHVSRINREIFGNTDVQLAFVLQGHLRGINWVAFHPTSKLIVSGADDQYVRLWRYNDVGGSEIETFDGHSHNVSCVMFHPSQDMIISNSEDKTIRFWSLSKGSVIDTHRSEKDRYWILGLHPTQNLIAAGHDTGFKVFKLNRERPPFYDTKTHLYYVKGDTLRRFRYSNEADTSVGTFENQRNNIHSISYSEADKALILRKQLKKSGKTQCELYILPKEKSSSILRLYSGLGTHCVFTGDKKFIFLERDDRIVVRTLYKTKRVIYEPTSTIGTVYGVFEGTPGTVILHANKEAHLFDIEHNNFINEVSMPTIKYVYWSKNKERVALMSRHTIVIANNRLETLCTIRETMRLKSGCFDSKDVFLYTTVNHLKYLLVNGDHGIMKTIKIPIYLVRVYRGNLFYMNRKGEVKKMALDGIEYKFKLALMKQNHRQIQKIINRSKLLGDSIISYLYNKGYPKYALKFVTDDQTKFNLAIECGDLITARQAAMKMNQKEAWEKLGEEAMKQGKRELVESSYKVTHNHNKLAFLYFVTGQIDKIKQVHKFSEKRKDILVMFQNSLLMGDVKERIRVLTMSKQHNLAYITALRHGMNELAEELKKLADPDLEIPTDLPEPSPMCPPKPLLVGEDWPLLFTQERLVDDVDGEGLSDSEEERDEDEDDEGGKKAGGGLETDAWGTLMGEDEPGEKKKKKKKEDKPEEEGGDDDFGMMDGWGGADLDMDEEEYKQALLDDTVSSYDPPKPGPSPAVGWAKKAVHPSEYIAAGDYHMAMKLFSEYKGIVNFHPLKEHFRRLYMACRGRVIFGDGNPIPAFFNQQLILKKKMDDDTRDSEDSDDQFGGGRKKKKTGEVDFHMPSLPPGLTFDELEKRLRTEAYPTWLNRKFEEAERIFLSVLHSLLFLRLRRGDRKRYNKLVSLCCGYLTGLKIEKTRKSLEKQDIKRSVELSCYFSRCTMIQKHLVFVLFQAMTVAFNAKNFLTAAQLAQRLIDLHPPQKFEAKARIVVKKSKSNPNNQHEVNADMHRMSAICTYSFSPINRGDKSVRCPFCKAHAVVEHKGQLCRICELANYGVGGRQEIVYEKVDEFDE